MNVKKIGVFVFVLALVIVVAGGYFYFSSGENTGRNQSQDQGKDVVNGNIEDKDKENLLGGDKDEHGCIGSAGYVWCEAKEKCIRSWEEDCQAEEKIKEALAKKENKPVSSVYVSINKENAEYASGGVSFTKEKGAPGGVFLAAKKDGKWEIVYSGNGSIDCASIKKNYNFPADMLVGFCD